VQIAKSGVDTLVATTGFDSQENSVSSEIYRLGMDGELVPFEGMDTLPISTTTPPEQTAVYDIAVSPEKRLIVAGESSPSGGFVAEFDLIAGALNSTFGNNGVATVELPGQAALALAVDPAGIITVAGASAAGSNVTPIVFRLTAAGHLDPGFNGGQVLSHNPCAFMLDGCQLQPNVVGVTVKGNVVLAGQGFFNGNSESMWAIRLRADGTPDTDFGSTVLGQAGLAQVDISSNSDSAYGLALQGERVVLGGTMEGGEGENNYDFALVRLADGSVFRDGLEDAP
jgi:uncharacterized delta-60 repeat protein